MATAFFDENGKCTCIISGKLSTMFDDKTIYSANVPDGTNSSHIYYDIVSNSVKNKEEFNVSRRRGQLGNIPKDAVAYINGERFIVDDGTLEIESNFAGSTILVILEHPQYISKTYEVRT